MLWILEKDNFDTVKFPLMSDLWLSAAKWEFEESKNPENARSLMQRGLRFNPSSRKLWQEVGVEGKD